MRYQKFPGPEVKTTRKAKFSSFNDLRDEPPPIREQEGQAEPHTTPGSLDVPASRLRVPRVLDEDPLANFGIAAGGDEIRSYLMKKRGKSTRRKRK